ncbi:MAG: hypothetical protein JW749_11940 [Sedimentisphaerales bacterium]|nr:hypothetical protein [Sedimentisphaerales bacterium]
MTRRKFLQNILAGGLAFLAGCVVFARGLPKKMIWAKPTAKYPGRLKAIENIETQANASTSSPSRAKSSEWSG